MHETSSLPLVVDAADPLSLASILPECLAEQVRDLPRELLIQDEVTLTTMVQPTDQQKRIKIQLWDEYEEAVKQKRVISLSNIIFGVCTRDYFLEFIKIKRNVAWLIAPRPSYKVRVAELIERGLDKVQEIFDLKPAMDGKNATAIANLHLAALRMLDMRKHGGYTQRVESKALNLTKNLDTPKGAQAPTGEGSIEELESQVRELEQKIQAGKNQNGALLAPANRDVIDITPRMVDGSEDSPSPETQQTFGD